MEGENEMTPRSPHRVFDYLDWQVDRANCIYLRRRNPKDEVACDIWRARLAGRIDEAQADALAARLAARRPQVACSLGSATESEVNGQK